MSSKKTKLSGYQYRKLTKEKKENLVKHVVQYKKLDSFVSKNQANISENNNDDNLVNLNDSEDNISKRKISVCHILSLFFFSY